MKTLQIILQYLEEKERNEWADDYHYEHDVVRSAATPSNVAAAAAASDDGAVNLDLFLRRTVDCMEEESQDLEVQRTGSRIIYLIYQLKLKQKNRNKKMKQQTLTTSRKNWYSDEEEVEVEVEAEQQQQQQQVETSHDSDEEELLIDVVEAILHAMEDFPDDELVQEDSCLAVEALTTTSLPTIHDDVVIHRILEEMLVAMEGLADNSVVVSASFGLLSNLSSSNSNSSFVKNPKLIKYAVSSVLHGMKEHKHNVAIYIKGYQALSNLTVGNYVAQQLLCCTEPLGLRILSEGLQLVDQINNP